MPDTLEHPQRSDRSRPSRRPRRSGAHPAVLIAAGVLVAATVGAKEAGAPGAAVFGLSALALALLAALVGASIEQVGERLGPGPTGLLQSSLGNLPELLVGIFALRAGLTSVVQAALVGSVLSNVLLVLGIAFLSGGVRHGTQRFSPEAPRMLVTLLTLAVASMLVPTLASRLDTPAVHHSAALSDATAAVLLVVYAASIPFWLGGGPEPHEQSERRRGRLGAAVVVLAGASIASGFVSDWFVSSLTPATRSLHISQVFTGLVIIAIASNAVENVAGIRFAWRARPDYAISAILNSPLQVTLLLTPLLVLVSPVIGPAHLTLVFSPLLIAAVAIAVVVVTVVVYDGEYSWLEGVALIALYALSAAAFWWG